MLELGMAIVSEMLLDSHMPATERQIRRLSGVKRRERRNKKLPDEIRLEDGTYYIPAPPRRNK